jgi:hypothetical protein
MQVALGLRVDWEEQCYAVAHLPFKIATTIYSKMPKTLQHVVWLNPKCKNYTLRMRIVTSIFKVGK